MRGLACLYERVEDEVGRAVHERHRGRGLQAQEEPDGPRPDGLRHRRHHRCRHLHADRQGGGTVRRTGCRLLLRHRRDLLWSGGALLRRVRLDGPGQRLGVHLLLRDPGRAGRLDHRLGPDPRADARRVGRRAGLEHLLRHVPRRDRPGLARQPGPLGLRLVRPLQPRRVPAGGDPDGAHRRRHQGVAAGQPGAGRRQAVHRPVRDRGRAVLHQGRQLPPVRAALGRATGRHRPDPAAVPVDLRLQGPDLRRPRHRLGRLDRVLRLHRLRRRRDHGRGGAQPAEGPARAASSARW